MFSQFTVPLCAEVVSHNHSAAAIVASLNVDKREPVVVLVIACPELKRFVPAAERSVPCGI